MSAKNQTITAAVRAHYSSITADTLQGEQSSCCGGSTCCGEDACCGNSAEKAC